MSYLRKKVYRMLPDVVKPLIASIYHRYLRFRFRPILKTVHLASGVSFKFKITDALAKAWYDSDTLSPSVSE